MTLKRTHGRLAPTRVDDFVMPEPRLVTSDLALVDLVAELADSPQYGIDTEFHRERTYFARLALLQVGWPGGIALIDPLSVEISRFADVLQGPGVAIFHAADQDLEVLERACGCVPKSIFDTQVAAGFLGISSASLVSLVEKMLARRLEKGDQLTDWTRRPLTDSQVRYAAGDVAHLIDLYDDLRNRLEAKGRLSWAEAECALALERSRQPVVPEEAWWRLRQARQLRGRDRGVAQEVAAWRERKAQSVDQPTRFLLSDLALASIAQRPPATRAELDQVRSIESRHLGGGGAEEILGAVGRGLALSNADLHLPPGPQGESVAKPAVTLAAAWVSERAKELQIDQAILATRADLVAFMQDPPVGRLQESWRNELVGEPIRRLVAGDLSLALEGQTLVLEERSRRRYLGSGTSGNDPAADG